MCDQCEVLKNIAVVNRAELEALRAVAEAARAAVERSTWNGETRAMEFAVGTEDALERTLQALDAARKEPSDE